MSASRNTGGIRWDCPPSLTDMTRIALGQAEARAIVHAEAERLGITAEQYMELWVLGALDALRELMAETAKEDDAA